MAADDLAAGFHPTTLPWKVIEDLVHWRIGTSRPWMSIWRRVCRFRALHRARRGRNQGPVSLQPGGLLRCCAQGGGGTAVQPAAGRSTQQPGLAEGKPLNDYLFHQYMRFAAIWTCPCSSHGAHGGIRNRVDKTNAAHLAPVFELHRDVRFDLFHGNWPHLGDLLYLGKNYPNVALDCCWLHIIDPDYASELLERSVFTLPHTKVHGFGGDYGDAPEFIAGHLQIARENIAGTLARLVERGWLSEEQALSLAADWLFNNRIGSSGWDSQGSSVPRRHSLADADPAVRHSGA